MRRQLAAFACTIWLCLTATAHGTDRLIPLDVAGLRAELSALEGRVVLINFWATWCRPCLEEIPTLMQLQTKLQDNGFSLVAVSLDDAASVETRVKPFMNKKFPGFTSYLSIERDMDSMTSVIDPAWNGILPTSYLLARDGSVAERLQGIYSAEEFSEKILALSK